VVDYLFIILRVINNLLCYR